MSELDDRIGYLLVKKGLINNYQLTKALEFQAKLNDRNYIHLGEILIQLGSISRANLIECLNEQTELRKIVPPPVSAIKPPPAQNYKLSIIKPNKPALKDEISQDIAEMPIIKQDNSRSGPKISNQIYADKAKYKPIGEIMLEKGFINREQLSHALQYQSVLPPAHYKPLGEILVELKFVTRENLNLALGIQPPISNNSLGEILKQFGLIDASKLAIVLSQQHSVGTSTPVGELLVQHGFITKEQLNRALEEQRRRNNKQ